VQPDQEREPGAAATEHFMYVAAHDLRNPIAVVKASAQMAQRQITRGDTAAAQGRLSAIVEQADRVTEILETFVDAARISAGRLNLRIEPVDLRDVIQAAVDRVRLLVGERGERKIEINAPDECIGQWDRVRVSRAFRALLANALLYGDPESPVTVAARAQNGTLVLSVTGGGPGPDEDELAHLFERFYRGTSAAEAGQSGSGLGLFTARGIAREHGGEVRRIRGDVFELELPLAAGQASQHA
jgi:signal transduction histidine kinase